MLSVLPFRDGIDMRAGFGSSMFLGLTGDGELFHVAARTLLNFPVRTDKRFEDLVFVNGKGSESRLYAFLKDGCGRGINLLSYPGKKFLFF